MKNGLWNSSFVVGLHSQHPISLIRYITYVMTVIHWRVNSSIYLYERFSIAHSYSQAVKFKLQDNTFTFVCLRRMKRTFWQVYINWAIDKLITPSQTHSFTSSPLYYGVSTYTSFPTWQSIMNTKIARHFSPIIAWSCTKACKNEFQLHTL